MGDRRLLWAENYTAADLLTELSRRAPHLLHTDPQRERGPRYDRRWRAALGWPEAPHLADEQDEREWARTVGSKALTAALRLSCSWEAPHMELSAAVAKWARAALTHIVGLEGETDRLAAELARTAAERDDARARAREDAAHAADVADNLRRCLDEARAETERERDTVARLRESLREAESAGREARAEGAAWRSAAESSGAALEILRAALRIPAPTGDGELVVVRRG